MRSTCVSANGLGAITGWMVAVVTTRHAVAADDDTDIMFTSDRGGFVDVYAMARDGSNVRNLTQNPAFDFVPDWTPAMNE